MEAEARYKFQNLETEQQVNTGPSGYNLSWYMAVGIKKSVACLRPCFQQAKFLLGIIKLKKKITRAGNLDLLFKANLSKFGYAKLAQSRACAYKIYIYINFISSQNKFNII